MYEVFLLESVYVFDFEFLCVFEIIFWMVWEGDEFLGCGVFKEFDEMYGEVKLMCILM